MLHPVLSIDVDIGKSIAVAFLAYGQIYRKLFAFAHSPADLASLLSLLQELQAQTASLPYVVMEATGHYSKPLVFFFSDHGFPVVLFNPLNTHQLKKHPFAK